MNTGEETAVIESIQPMFPDVDRETVRAVLESTGFHAESAVEALLGMVAIDGAGASGPQEQPPSGVADLLSLAAEPPSSEQQIADDEALARQLQQQLAWEDQLHNEQIALEHRKILKISWRHCCRCNWSRPPRPISLSPCGTLLLRISWRFIYFDIVFHVLHCDSLGNCV